MDYSKKETDVTNNVIKSKKDLVKDNLKSYLKIMKNEISLNPHLSDMNIYLTSEFECDIKIKPLTTIHMISYDTGYFIENGSFHKAIINDNFLINYFKKLNLIMPSVTLFVIGNNKLAFKTDSDQIIKSKSNLELKSIEIIGKLPMYIINDYLFLDKLNNSLYYITGSGINKEYHYLDEILNKNDVSLFSENFYDGDSFKVIIAHKNLNEKYVLDLDVTNYKKAT